MILLMAVVLSGCKSEKEEQRYSGPDTGPAYGDLFIDGSIGDASTLLPPLAMDASSASIIGLVYNGLVKYDGDLNLVGDLAESWDISKDGLTITFHLRHGVKWQDGAPFTAQDVLFTYQVMVDPKTPTAYSGDYLQVKKAEAPDDYTFRVTYPQPFAPALGSWGLAILPRHLLTGQDITKSPLGRRPIGTGPYVFKEWRAGEKIALAYNPDYFEGRTYLNGYLYLVKPDLATMFLELKAGNLDRMNLTPLQYTRQTEYPKFHRLYKKYRYMPFSYIYLGYNLNNARFADRRVRQALTHAINKKEIIDGVLMGLGQEAYGPYKPGTWYYNPDVPKFSYDPAKAKALLAKAGYPSGFSTTVYYNSGNSERQETAVTAQAELAAVGIHAQVRSMAWPSFVNGFQTGTMPMFVVSNLNPPIPQLYVDQNFVSSSAGAGGNYAFYKNAQLDALAKKLDLAVRPAAQQQLMNQIQQLLAKTLPEAFLYNESIPYLQGSWVHGWALYPAGDWYFNSVYKGN